MGDLIVFGWRKRNEGFEWREYVRTTILVRRQRRRQHVKDAQEAAVFGVKQAGRRSASAAALGAASFGRGLAVSAAWLFETLRRLAVRIGEALAIAGARSAAVAAVGLSRAAAVLGPAVSRAGSHAAAALDPLLSFVRQPGISLPLTLIAWISAISAAHRIWAFGLDGQATFAGAIALAAFALTLGPRLASGDRPRPRMSGYLDRAGESLVLLPGLDRLRPRQASVLALLAGTIVASGGIWLATRPAPLTSMLARVPLIRSPRLEGHAVATGGNSLRLAGSIVILDGIEAPERDQVCATAGRRWRCGTAARDALARMTRGRRIACEVTGSNEAKAKLARCTVDGTDLAAELVRGGHVFAAPGLFSRYASLESAARSAKAGLWAGDAERPSEYRAKRWEDAKRAAPEGCPIKGRVAAGERVYVLPWSPSYDQVHLVSARGERWFCSEEEALTAGWRPSAPS